MKRSSQIALVLMGATAVGSTSYAMMPRNECRPPAQQQTGVPVPPNPAAQPEPCRESRRSGSTSSSGYSRWGSSGSSSIWSRRSPQPTSTSTSVAMRPSGSSVPAVSSHSSSTTSTASRGGFGSTGHGFSSGG
jgi:hypothetical protein